jgi:hypothetical protein
MKHTLCDEQIVVRLPAELRGRIEQKAVEEDRSFSAMTRRLLNKAVSAPDSDSLRFTWPPGVTT